MNIPNPSPNWTPDERLQVIASIANLRMTEILDERPQYPEYNYWDAVNDICTLPANALENMRGVIFSLFK